LLSKVLTISSRTGGFTAAREKLLADKIDVTDFIVETIERVAEKHRGEKVHS